MVNVMRQKSLTHQYSNYLIFTKLQNTICSEICQISFQGRLFKEKYFPNTNGADIIRYKSKIREPFRKIV